MTCKADTINVARLYDEFLASAPKPGCMAGGCDEHNSTWRERFGAVLCNYHHLLALLGWLNSQPKMLERRG